jgi:uncharacterized damage-inducible protein DinB
MPECAIQEDVTFSTIGGAHLRYHRWSTSQLLEETTPLPSEQLVKDLKGSFPSIYDTLIHLFQADSIWLDRLQGRPTGVLADYAAPGCTYELRDASLGVLDNMVDWAGTLSEADWSREMFYKTLAGAAYTSPLWQMVLHVVNHGSHHRGQITGMLRQLGIKPVNLDLIGFYRRNG